MAPVSANTFDIRRSSNGSNEGANGARNVAAPIAGEQAAPSLEQRDSTINRLVRLAVRSDDVGDLLPVLWSAIRRPMAVVDHRGMPLGQAPAGDRGQKALDVGLGVVRDGAGPRPAGWQVFPLQPGPDPLGVLVLCADPPLRQHDEAILEISRSLLADQLQRVSLATRVHEERRDALKRKLISTPGLAPQIAKSEAERARMPLADHYWPAVVVWDRGELDQRALDDIEDLSHRYARESFVVLHDGRTIVLLLAQETAGTDHQFEVQFLVEGAASLVQSRLPASRVHGIVGEASAPPQELGAQVRKLQRLSRYAENPNKAPARPVLSAKCFALHTLLEGLDRKHAVDFVLSQIGPLLAYDRAHETNLADTLENSLDAPSRDEAAKVSYMHRNTFRRHVKHALELVGSELTDPDERLAVHAALKLRSLLGLRTAQSSQRSDRLSGGRTGARAPSGPWSGAL